ncbi:MAG: tetratricopeptide repeat protein [Planctomycetota bacterium]
MSTTQMEPGQILNNRYRIDRLLGRGGMGQVYLAEDLSGGGDVALKTIREGVEEADRRRFEREIRTLRTLSHPHIVPFRDLGLAGESIFYTMEYHAGVTLEDVLEKHGALQTTEALDWFLRVLLQVADALSYLHQRRLVHRDIKPANILLSVNDGSPPPSEPAAWVGLTNVTASLTDFGLVKTRDGDGALTRTALGTPQYMSPEQIEASPAVDERSDLYSLGVILYRAATGQLPYERLSDALSRTPARPARELNPELPEILEQGLEWMLQFEAFRRPSNATEAMEVLGSILDRRAPAHDSAPAISKLSQPVFSGRRDEIEKLSEIATAAVRGNGHWASITGERGIGKSWLLERSEFKSRALLQSGADIYQGTFSPGRAHSGFQQLLSAMLRHIDRHHGRDHAIDALGRWGQSLRSLFPQLQVEGWLDDCPSVDGSVPHEILKERVFETVVGVLCAFAEVEPRVIVLEDVHYGDDFDLELLRRLVLSAIQLPILVVTTHRSEFQGRVAGLERLLHEIRSEERLLEIEMLPFGAAETRTMVQSMLAPARAVPEPFVEVLLERTDGVPLYLLHLVNSLWNRELISLNSAGWHVDPDAVRELPIPESTRSHFLLVLDEMSADELKVLNIAAVLGTTFSFDVLLEAVEGDEFALDALCRNLVHAGVLQEHQNGFRFLHSFEQEIILQRLSQPMQRRLHARVGKVLEVFYHDTLDDHIGEIAEHMYLGGDQERGVEYLRRAALQAEKAYATRAALDYNRKALELCQDPNYRPMLLVAIGDQHLKLGEHDQAVHHFREAIGYFTQVEELLLDDNSERLTAEQKQELEDYVQLLLKFGEVSTRRGDFAPALENFQKAEQIARRVNAAEKIALSLVSQAATFAFREDFDGAVRSYENAIEIYEAQSPVHGHGLASAWGGLAAVVKVRGDLPRASECFQRGLKISQDTGDQLLTARLLTNLGNLYRAEGNMQDAVDAFERALDIRDRYGDRQGVAICFMNLGRAHALLGDLRRSLEALTHAQEAFQAIGDKHGTLLTLGNLGTLHFYLGAFDTAQTALQEYLNDASRSGVVRCVADARHSLGVLHVAIGEIASAERLFEQSLSDFEKAGDREGSLLNRVQLARVRAHQGRVEDALSLCNEVRNQAMERNAQEPLAEALRVSAECYRSTNDPESAEPLALEALRNLENQHLTYHQGVCCRTLGKIY